ncbi:MAG: metalloregulator ArsR/SmtB family transcription factor [Nitriliruptorales bacterium]|nr:metalloregulator ArsR/SmtB family transcription factor [Nitriliruptorales bacterium]
MPVLDMAASDAKLPVEVAVSPAVELLLSLAASGMEDRGGFEVAALESLIDRADDRIEELRTWFLEPSAKTPIRLVGLVTEVGLSAEIDQFIDHVRGIDPGRLVDVLTEHEGEDDARIADRDPAEVRADVVELLEGWAGLAAELVDEGMPAVRKDADARRARIEEMTADELVEEATNGVKLSRHPGLERVVLFPSYVFRPWVLLSEHAGTRVICYPVADEFLEHEAAAPPARLVKLFKALGDEGRLKLLRRLAAGPMNLSEATELLGVAKSTAHHHLAILRQAGLVLVDPDDGTYAFRQQLVPEAADLLQDYLEPSSSD